MSTVLLEPIAPTKTFRAFRGKNMFKRLRKFIEAGKHTGRLINVVARNYNGERVIFVNYYLRSI